MTKSLHKYVKTILSVKLSGGGIYFVTALFTFGRSEVVAKEIFEDKMHR